MRWPVWCVVPWIRVPGGDVPVPLPFLYIQVINIPYFAFLSTFPVNYLLYIPLPLSLTSFLSYSQVLPQVLRAWRKFEASRTASSKKKKTVHILILTLEWFTGSSFFATTTTGGPYALCFSHMWHYVNTEIRVGQPWTMVESSLASEQNRTKLQG